MTHTKLWVINYELSFLIGDAATFLFSKIRTWIDLAAYNSRQEYDRLVDMNHNKWVIPSWVKVLFWHLYLHVRKVYWCTLECYRYLIALNPLTAFDPTILFTSHAIFWYFKTWLTSCVMWTRLYLTMVWESDSNPLRLFSLFWSHSDRKVTERVNPNYESFFDDPMDSRTWTIRECRTVRVCEYLIGALFECTKPTRGWFPEQTEHSAKIFMCDK